MDAHCTAQDVVAGKAWNANVQTAGLHTDSLLTSADLHSFLERSSWDNLDTCHLASSPESLFSPKPSSRDLALPAGEGSLFAELFPGSLLFPSPNAQPSPPTEQLAAEPAAANPAARLPTKIFERLPSESGVAAAAAAGGPSAARNLMGRLDICAAMEQQLPEQPPSPKRRRTSLFHSDAKPQQAVTAATASAGEEEASDSELGSCWEAPGSTMALDGSADVDTRLMNKRARNREAARRLRQRQRQLISRTEDELGAHHETIKDLVGKLSTATSGVKFTAKENALLRQLLASVQAQALMQGGLPACDAGLLAGAGPVATAADLSSDLGDPLLLGSLLLPQLPLSGEQLLLPKPAESLFADPAAAAVAPPASPCRLPAPAFLPPSPFESPRKAAPSPSKPPTPARLALRSPFAAAPRPHALACVQLLPPAAISCDKALLLEQLTSTGGPLQQGVARALLQGLQEAQERELGGVGPEDEETVSEEEAVQIAATALLHAQGNVNAAVMHLLRWSGHGQDSLAC